MTLIYPAIFHKEENAFWVEFPDLIGCQSFGSSAVATYLNAKEALVGYCEEVLAQGHSLPEPSDISFLEVPEDCFPSLVEVHISVLENV